MTTLLQNYIAGAFVNNGGDSIEVLSAIDDSAVARLSTQSSNMAAAVEYAKSVGGPELRKLSFHQRAKCLKNLALYIKARKAELYTLSYLTGATQKDSWIDIDGGITTALVFASKAKIELEDSHIILDGAMEGLSRKGSFVGQHIYSSRPGVAVHINAFNFPVWGLLEKFAPAFLAGMPVIAKSASATSYVAHQLMKIIDESGILPAGALQFVAGTLGDTLDHLGVHDAVAFTGSAATAQLLRGHAAFTQNGASFISEQDSLNASLLTPDAVAGSPEFDLFVGEIFNEMTTKAGQKCTAIRRILVPEALADAVTAALAERFATLSIGDPRLEDTQMGALTGRAQRDDVLAKLAVLQSEATLVAGGDSVVSVPASGAFLAPCLLRCDNPDTATQIHAQEAFGPVATLLPYQSLDQAVTLINRGGGSLVGSIFGYDPDQVKHACLAMAPWHGRIYINNRDSAKEATTHGSPLPHLVHGGPGRAGGGEEMGGVRGIKHYMQRSAIQGSPNMITHITDCWTPGSDRPSAEIHPFQQTMAALEIGQTFKSAKRKISMDDIEHFAHFTGDTFYAHMSEEDVKDHPFFPGRVAHGYLLLSFAAGLFVSPEKGPVLANYGLENLRFLSPVQADEEISVQLTVQQMKPRNADYGEVRWYVEITVHREEGDATAATYQLLTMNQ
ncbi:MAG: phenylacetic acid degradation bifunctional protein PaaZ [Gammaproteobacteria bacterium]|nr:phenylacetic acid degradation bifunctional protein PaaZ [Gammaproteobacteria bacterium]